MKLTKIKNEQAVALLSVIEAMYGNRDDDIDIMVSDFNNCREQGYVLQLSSIDNGLLFHDQAMWIAFAQNRNSDSIVVYTDTGFYPDSVDQIEEHVWRDSKMFGFGEFTVAADYINELFTQQAQAIRLQRIEQEVKA